MNKKKYLVRQIVKEDLKQLLELQRVCYVKNYWEDQSVFEKMLLVFPEGAFLILDKDKLIGYIFFHPYTFGKIKSLNNSLMLLGDENCLYIHDLCIHPNYRGLGLTKLFLDLFNQKTHFYKYNYQALVAVQGSEKFWRKFGFQISKKIKYRDKDAYYLTKDIKLDL